MKESKLLLLMRRILSSTGKLKILTIGFINSILFLRALCEIITSIFKKNNIQTFACTGNVLPFVLRQTTAAITFDSLICT